MEEVLRHSSLVPLAFPCFVLCSIGGGNRRAFRLPGKGGIISIVRWNLRPVIFGVDKNFWRNLDIRSEEKAKKVMAECTAAVPDAKVTFMELDTGKMKSVKACDCSCGSVVQRSREGGIP